MHCSHIYKYSALSFLLIHNFYFLKMIYRISAVVSGKLKKLLSQLLAYCRRGTTFGGDSRYIDYLVGEDEEYRIILTCVRKLCKDGCAKMETIDSNKSILICDFENNTFFSILPFNFYDELGYCDDVLSTALSEL